MINNTLNAVNLVNTNLVKTHITPAHASCMENLWTSRSPAPPCVMGAWLGDLLKPLQHQGTMVLRGLRGALIEASIKLRGYRTGFVQSGWSIICELFLLTETGHPVQYINPLFLQPCFYATHFLHDSFFQQLIFIQLFCSIIAMQHIFCATLFFLFDNLFLYTFLRVLFFVQLDVHTFLQLVVPINNYL